MHIWISGGGTGGHVYPALTVLDSAGAEVTEVLWVGTATGLEARLAPRHGVPFRAIAAGPLVGADPVRLVRSVLALARGTWQAWRLLGRNRPDAVLVTGGYVSVPVALAARCRGVPLIVFLPDVRPGRAVQLVARLADVVATTAEPALAHLPPGRGRVTGYPVRGAVRRAGRGEAREALGLSPEGPVVLVFGGSQGARRLNEAMADAAPTLLARAEVVHVTGSLDIGSAQRAAGALPTDLAARYVLREYLHETDMAHALAAADLVVSRAGAAVMGEYPARGLPSILVPLPIAGGHQRLNAAVLVDAGAALIADDAEMDGPRLVALVAGLLDDPGALATMSDAARRLDRPEAAADIWRVVKSAASHGSAVSGGPEGGTT